MVKIWGSIIALLHKILSFVTNPLTLIIVLVFVLFLLLISLLTVISKWIIYKRAGFPGWACLVPFYSNYILVRVAGLSGWFFLLTLIPQVGPYAIFIFQLFLANAFGKRLLFGIGLNFLPFVFYPILWLSGAKYLSPKLSSFGKHIKDSST